MTWTRVTFQGRPCTAFGEPVLTAVENRTLRLVNACGVWSLLVGGSVQAWGTREALERSAEAEFSVPSTDYMPIQGELFECPTQSKHHS